MNNIKELTKKLQQTLNTIDEKENKIKTVEDAYLKWFNENKTYLFTQEFTQEKKETLKEERDKKNKKITELRKNIEELSIKVKALKNNIQYSFIENNTSYIEEILNKYAIKRVGEKTEAKIEKELQNILLEKNNIDDIYLYLNIKEYNNGIYIRFEVNKSRFEVEYNISSSQKWFNDDREKDMKIKLNNIYCYIDNIDKYTAYIINEQEKIKAEKEKLNKRIRKFNDNLKGKELYGTYNIRNCY